MILLFVLGCWKQVEMHCEWAERVPSESEPLDLGFRIDDLLTEAAVPQRVDAVGLGGEPLPLDLALSRGDGAAALRDATVVEEATGLGENRAITWIGEDQHCTDELTLPVWIDLASADASDAVALSGPATLANLPFHDSTPTPPLQVAYTIDPAVDRLPAGNHGPPVAGNVWVTYEDGLVTALEARVETSDGTLETVAWYLEPR